jgi:hypothetical protein
MSEEQCAAILASNPFAILAADPGVNNPATICDELGRILTYTNKRRQDENCNWPHQRWLKAEKRKHPPYVVNDRAAVWWKRRKRKKKKKRRKRQHPPPPAVAAPAPPPAAAPTPHSPVMAAEAKLSGCRSRTLSSVDYKEYLRTRKEEDPVLREFYERPSKKFEKMRYRRYCKQAWSDAKLVREIKDKFLTEEQRVELSMIEDKNERRDKVLIVFGNWSRSSQMKGCAPSPG